MFSRSMSVWRNPSRRAPCAPPCAALGRRAPHLGRGAREARRGRRLLHARDAEDAAAARGCADGARASDQRQHRREAGVRALEHLHPLVARLRLEGRRERPCASPASARGRSAAAGPGASGAAAVPRRTVASIAPIDDVLAVLRLVDVVPGRAGVEDVGAALLGPAARRRGSRRTSRRAARRLPPSPRPPPGPCPSAARASSAQAMPKPSSMPPPPKSPTRLSGGTGACALAAERVQHAGERDVVDVVAGARGERPVLAPAGHAAVDQPRVARRGRHPARGRGAPSRRGESLRSARRPSPISSSAAAAASFAFRSSVTERLPRIITSIQRSRFRPRSVAAGRSTSSTSAPMSASSMPANGAGADRLEFEDPDAGKRARHLLVELHAKVADHLAPARVEVARDARHLRGRHAGGFRAALGEELLHVGMRGCPCARCWYTASTVAGGMPAGPQNQR